MSHSLRPIPDRFPDGGVPTFVLSTCNQWGVRTWLETQMNLAPTLVKFFLESLCIGLSFVERMVIFNQDRLTRRRVLSTLQGVPRAIRCPLELLTPLHAPEALLFHVLVPESKVNVHGLWLAKLRAKAYGQDEDRGGSCEGSQAEEQSRVPERDWGGRQKVW